VRDYNGIDGCASVRGSLCRVDAHEEWGRRNAPSGRCSHAPANDVAASTGLQHSIDRRPADLEGLRDLGSPEPRAFIARTWAASIEAGRHTRRLWRLPTGKTPYRKRSTGDHERGSPVKLARLPERLAGASR
jgi:hypothetical protein